MLKRYASSAVCALFLTTFSIAQLGFTNASGIMSNTTHSGGAMGVVDMNGDGLDDLAKLHMSNIFQIDYQNPDGTFTLVDHGQITDDPEEYFWAMALGDILNDGHKDMIAGGSYLGVPFLQIASIGNATLNHLNEGSIFMQGMNIVDMNYDSHNDLFGCHDHAAPKIWMNDGTGTLLFNGSIMDFTTEPPSDMSGNYGSVWSDFDNDGDVDLYIAKCKQGVLDLTNPLRWNQLFVNDGNGNFTEMAETFGVQVKFQSWTADLGDTDNDGDMDMVITNHDHTVQLFENDGTGNYTEITAGSGLEVTGFFLQSKFVDFDNDGYLDLILAGGIERFFKNNGDNTFTQITGLFPSSKAMHSFATGDLNNDGFMDVFASYGSGYVEPDMEYPDRLWLNNGNDNHWLTVRLQGTQSNRDAIGARVTLTGPWGTQIREVRAGESYGIVTTFACNFGLGQYTTIPTLTVDWPSGLQEVFTNVTVDQTITVIEGVCISPMATITFPGAQVLCSGGSPITLEAPPGFNYTWSTNATSQSITVSEPGNYSVLIDDGSACTGTTSVFVPLDPDETPQLSASGNLRLCEGDTIELSTTSTYPMVWSTGETGNSIMISEGGEYSVTVTGTCDTFTSDIVTAAVYPAAGTPTTEDATIPYGTQATLTATGENIQWYDQPEGGEPVATGNEFVTPPLTFSTSYWATAAIIHEGEIFYGGKEENSPSGIYHTNANFYLLFEAYQPMLIRSVKVYANGTNNRQIALIDESDGTTVASGIFNIPDGESRVDLNMLVPSGGSYGLRVVGGNPQLWRDPAGSGVNYPYDLGGLGAITSSTAGNQHYYFFYDWEVSLPALGCESPRTEVFVTVGPVGIEVEQRMNDLQVYPNPADELITIALGGISGDILIEFVDVLGRTVTNSGFTVRGGNVDLDVSELAAGDYLIRIHSDQGVIIRHVIIN